MTLDYGSATITNSNGRRNLYELSSLTTASISVSVRIKQRQNNLVFEFSRDILNFKHMRHGGPVATKICK